MASTTTEQKTSVRVHVQRFGTFLSGMIMPNIAAFIAWGFITAFFIPTGWTPNESLATLVGPMITYLLPLLIANTGGRMVYGVRGGVIGTIATMGVILGADVPMFLGAMIVGPLAAWIMKQIDKLWAGKIPAGFEMLVDNFSGGIVGMILAIGAFFGIAPAVAALSGLIEAGVDFLVAASLLPLASLFIEPGKILFLNNAINQGVLTPLGIQQSEETGKSILFLLEANPGPGLGVLLAFAVFGIGLLRGSAPGAIIIHFFGGIHEIYFPYVLAKPLLVLAVIGGGMTGILTNVIFQSGLRAPASPGSIIAVLIQTASDSYLGVILSVIFSAGVSFLIASVIIRASRKRDLAAEAAGEDQMAAALAKNAANKGRDSNVGALLNQSGANPAPVPGTETLSPDSTGNGIAPTPVRNIVFACDAGMGSSAMGATVLRNKIKKAGIDDVTVVNKSIANLTPDADLVITHKDLTDRARQQVPNAQHVSVDNFMGSPKYDEVVALVQQQHTNNQ
jgi:PTS system mannitol-specific IIC component